MYVSFTNSQFQLTLAYTDAPHPVLRTFLAMQATVEPVKGYGV